MGFQRKGILRALQETGLSGSLRLKSLLSYPLLEGSCWTGLNGSGLLGLTVLGTPRPPTPSRERGFCLGLVLIVFPVLSAGMGLERFSRRGEFVRAWWKMSAWNYGWLKTAGLDLRTGLVLGESGRETGVSVRFWSSWEITEFSRETQSIGNGGLRIARTADTGHVRARRLRTLAGSGGEAVKRGWKGLGLNRGFFGNSRVLRHRIMLTLPRGFSRRLFENDNCKVTVKEAMLVR